jgi:hypothetical protein
VVVPPSRKRLTRARRLAAAAALAVAALSTAPAALAADPTAPVYDGSGRLIETPFAPSAAPPALREEQAVRALLAVPKVARWLDRYPRSPTTEADFDRRSRHWRVHVWSGRAGEVATGVVDDAGGRVLEAWTGPQVAWKMARGRPGAFGGRTLTSWPVWLALSAVFFVVLADVRRPLALRNLDLLVLLSFGLSLVFFNRGEVFRSVPLAYPPLLYLLARMAWIGFRRRPLSPARPVWPVWLLAALAVFLVGLRIGLNVQSPRGVIDVGYAGVIGADRILDGEAPYGHMPVEDDRTPCGPADGEGEIRERIQVNGRCESANPRGDTYGPVAYIAYVPAVVAFGWSGRWDSLPAAHASAIAFDLLTLAGLILVGLRLGGGRLAATLAAAWSAYPFTAYALLANTNDSLMPAVLVWGFWLASSPWARGAAVSLAGWTKFAALLVAPLWLAYPDGLRVRSTARFVLAFAAATLAAFAVLLLEPDLGHALRTFWDRTIGFQLDRESPFSVWGWGQYHAAGIPDLGWLRTALEPLVVALAVAAAIWPRRREPLELAALTAAILIATQLVLTHWFYLYLPWVLPFVVLSLLLTSRRTDSSR